MFGILCLIMLWLRILLTILKLILTMRGLMKSFYLIIKLTLRVLSYTNPINFLYILTLLKFYDAGMHRGPQA